MCSLGSFTDCSSTCCLVCAATGAYYWKDRNYAVNISFWSASQPSGCATPSTCMLQSRQTQVDETTYTASTWSLANCSMSKQFVCEYHGIEHGYNILVRYESAGLPVQAERRVVNGGGVG